MDVYDTFVYINCVDFYIDLCIGTELLLIKYLYKPEDGTFHFNISTNLMVISQSAALFLDRSAVRHTDSASANVAQTDAG